MKIVNIIPFALLLCSFLFVGGVKVSTNRNSQTITESEKFTPKKKIYLQPLGYVKPKTLENVKNSIEKFYGFDCIIKPIVPFTNDILAESKTRYEASKILDKFKSDQNIVVITEKDIATQKGIYKEWGVFGLGYMPGPVCVVSTHRLKRNVTEIKFYDRLEKVVLHEIGHNLGLPHCEMDIRCMMNDAKGTIKQVDNEKLFLCSDCKKMIGMR